MRWSLLTLLLKAIEQNNDFAFVKYKEYSNRLHDTPCTRYTSCTPHAISDLCDVQRGEDDWPAPTLGLIFKLIRQ